MNTTLPFRRGSTAGDLGLPGITLTDTLYQQWEGYEAEVQDTVHGTGESVIIRAVKNDSGAAIAVVNKFLKFSATTKEDFGNRIAGYNDAAGGVVVAMDDAYPVGTVIPEHDIFWVVVKGRVTLTTEASAVSLAAGNSVASDDGACVNGTVVAPGEYIAGSILEASTTADALVVVRMTGNLSMPEASPT